MNVQPILQENYPFLRQKICLMALIESVFKRGAYDRTMSFQTIAEETRLPLDEVEHLVMKALRYERICACYFPSSVLISLPSLQPQAHQGIAGSGGPKGTDFMGAAAGFVKRTNWSACAETCRLGIEAAQGRRADCSRGSGEQLNVVGNLLYISVDH